MDITPCGVLYKTIGEATSRKKYDEIDARIISRTFFDEKGRSPYDRVLGSGSFRTREIIQKHPDQLDPRFFKDAHFAALDILSLLRHAGMSNVAVVDYITGPACDQMVDSLQTFEYDYHLFRNAMFDIVRNNDPSDSNTATAVLVLYLLTAFHGNPATALPSFLDTMNAQALAIGLETGMLEDDPLASAAEQSLPLLGLVRKYPGGETGMHVYALRADGQGTVIGRAAVGENAISDVGPTVSRRHLLVFRKDSTWYARGLGSANGSRVARASGEETVIEPKRQTSVGGESAPCNVAIQAGDRLLLGLDTEFEVVLIGHQK